MKKPMDEAEISGMLHVIDTSLSQITEMEQEMLTFRAEVIAKVTKLVALADEAATTLKTMGAKEKIE